MGITRVYSEELGVWLFEAVGDITIEEILEAAGELLSDRSMVRGARTLWDLRKASLGSIGREQLQLLVNFSEDHRKERGAGKSAMVVSNDLEFGLARMYQSLSSDLPTTRRVFEDWDEAVAWIVE